MATVPALSLPARCQLWCERHRVLLARAAIGIVFFWFGTLKLFPGLCDVEPLAQRTLVVLTLGLLPPPVLVRSLAVAECCVGLVMFFAPARLRVGRQILRLTLVAVVVQLTGTFLPLLLFRAETWKHPFVLTFAGQYIVKNVALLSAAAVVGAQVFGDADHLPPPPNLRAMGREPDI